jgi:hypothetical protein
MVTKGLLKPDLTTSKEVLFLKSRLPEIAEAINNMRQTKSQEYQEIVREEQQPPPPQLEPIVITQASEQKQIPDITRVSLSEEILIRLQALEKQVQDQQLEIQQLKAKNLELETELNKKIKDLKKEETDDYNHLAEVININHNALNEHINNSEEYFEKLRIKLETLEKRVGDNELHEIEKEIARRLH